MYHHYHIRDVTHLCYPVRHHCYLFLSLHISQAVSPLIMLKNSSSSIFFLPAAQDSTSLPAKYRRRGFGFAAASRIIFATNSASDAFFASSANPAIVFCISSEYGDVESCAFLAMAIAFPKLVLIKPGSIKITLIPNGSNSYAIDSLKPSTANLVPT